VKVIRNPTEENVMHIKESLATVLVRFTGLGIFCFNPQRGRGEIAAIRDDKHTLTVVLRQPVYQDGAGKDLVVYQEVASYKNLPKQGVEIEIKALSDPAIEGYEIYKQGNFDRLSSLDANDFRWVVNMDDLNGDTPLRPSGHGPDPLSKLFVSNGLFYTYRVDSILSFEKVEIDASGAEKRREVFGNVAETVGVKIEAAEVGFTIRIGGVEQKHTFQRVAGLPAVIEIQNMDYNPNAVYSDMADYYGYLSSPDGKQFRLEPIREDDDETRGGSVNQQQFCHPVASDLPSIEQL
jgi:hypothetical protein